MQWKNRNLCVEHRYKSNEWVKKIAAVHLAHNDPFAGEMKKRFHQIYIL